MQRASHLSFAPKAALSLMKACILIPALNPSHTLLTLVEELLADARVFSVIVINDGSSEASRPVFEALAKLPKVAVLRHAVNLGKGAGLRTGINHFMCQELGDDAILITADADGQHLVKDILAVGECAAKSPGSLVLGSRTFGEDTPLRSKFGNEVTKKVFSLFIGISVPDTQTGLRAIPRSLMPRLMRIRASKYDYELEMLIRAARARCPMEFVPIETVYLDGNATSHFNPVLDSMRIYFIFARFASSSFLACLIDFIIFAIFLQFTASIGWSIVVARAISGTFNFLVNRTFVFHSGGDIFRPLLKYMLLLVLLGVVAYASIYMLTSQFHWNPYAAKVVIEVMLFVYSFASQRDLVFERPED